MSGVLFVFLATLCWSVDTLIRYPLLFGGVKASQIVFFEHLFLVLLLSFNGKFLISLFQKKEVKALFSFLIIGLVGSALATLAYTHAFSILNPSVVILIQKFQPIIAIILARLILKESFKKEFFLWGGICLLGGFLISYQDLFNLAGEFKSDFSFEGKEWGYLLTIFAVLGWGSSTVFGKKLSLQGFSSSEILFGRFFFGLLGVAPFLVGSGEIPQTSDYYGKIFIMVALSGLLGMWLYYKGLQKIPARICTLIETSFPFCAVIVNWIFLDQQLSALQMIGGVTLLLGSVMAQMRSA